MPRKRKEPNFDYMEEEAEKFIVEFDEELEQSVQHIKKRKDQDDPWAMNVYGDE